MNGTTQEGGTDAGIRSSSRKMELLTQLAALKERAHTVVATIQDFWASPSSQKVQQMIDSLERLKSFSWITQAKWEELLEDTKKWEAQNAQEK